MILEDSLLTYSELNRKANQLAHFLTKLNIKPDDRIAICLDRSFELIISIIGILKAGASYVPLDANYPGERLRFILEDSQANILITSSKIKGKFSLYQGNLIEIDNISDQISGCDTHNPAVDIDSHNLIYVIYTSGSTGKPKGVLVEHKAVVNTLHALQTNFPLRETDAYLFKTNHVFDISVAEIFGWIFQGGKLVLISCGNENSADEILNIIEKNKITHVNFVPSVLHTLLDSVSDVDFIKLTCLKYLFVGGEAIDPWLVHRVKNILPEHIRFENLYGPTESTVWATHFNLRSDFNSINTPIGKPLENITTYILDDDLNMCKAGLTGELFIGGNSLARGYLNSPQLTAEKFIPNPFNNDPDKCLYKTGDLCRYLPDGNIEYLERIDSQVKIRGFRIELGEIESCIALHPDIKRNVVIAREDYTGEKVLVCYYLHKSDSEGIDVSAFRQYLLQHLPIHMVPSMFISLESFPLALSGKLDRKALPELDLLDIKYYVAPRTDLEKIISAIWEKELNLEKVSIFANFFELGGHSLIAARIISKLEKRLQKKIKFSDLYAAPTVAEFGKTIALVSSNNNVNELYDTGIFTTLKHCPKSIPLAANQFDLWLLKKLRPRLSGLRMTSCKRIFGKIDRSALHYAFEILVKNHEIFTYHISNYIPLQYYQHNCNFHLIEDDLRGLSEYSKEEKLSASWNRLIIYNEWSKVTPLLIAKLFTLDEGVYELQICVPHIIFDEVSLLIFYDELTRYYRSYKNKENVLTNITPYKNYIGYERNYINKHIHRDIHFWTGYLNNSQLYTVASDEISDDSDTQHDHDLTTVELPVNFLLNLKKIQLKNKVNITDLLYASTILNVKKHLSSNHNKHDICAIITRSGRIDDKYDNTIGNLIRQDFVKVDAGNHDNLVETAKNIHQSQVETEAYQLCPLAVKLGCLFDKISKTKKLQVFFANIISAVVTSLLSSIKIHSKQLSMSMRGFISAPKNQYALVINVINTFISDNNNHEEDLLGLKAVEIRNNEAYGGENKNFIGVTFSINSDKKRCLLVASNLKPALRKKIAEGIIRDLFAETKTY